MALQAGANTKLHLATETTYGTPPGGVPYVVSVAIWSLVFAPD